MPGYPYHNIAIDYVAAGIDIGVVQIKHPAHLSSQKDRQADDGQGLMVLSSEAELLACPHDEGLGVAEHPEHKAQRGTERFGEDLGFVEVARRPQYRP